MIQSALGELDGARVVPTFGVQGEQAIEYRRVLGPPSTQPGERALTGLEVAETQLGFGEPETERGMVGIAHPRLVQARRLFGECASQAPESNDSVDRHLRVGAWQ